MRVGRYIVGALQALAQMIADEHQQSYTFYNFFSLLKYLVDMDCVVSALEWNHVMANNGQIPPGIPDQYFRSLIET